MAQHKNQDAQGFEVAVYRLVKDFLLPQLRHFIEKFMSWTYMSSPEYEDTKVINRFRREIIGPLQSKLKEFRPVPVVP